jgi:parvulin-like peptidyl-prolyl isomerase
MKKLTIITSIVFVFLVAFTGCAKQEDFAVKVNDKLIPKKIYEDKLNAYKEYLEKQGLDFASEQGKVTLESIKNEVLEGLIGTELMEQEIAKNNWDLKDPEVRQQVEELKSQLPAKDFQKWLDEQAMTEDEITEYFTFTRNITKDVTVTEQEVKHFFDANYARYGGQDEQVKARHILLATEEEAWEVIQELNSGTDFAELAQKKSIEPAAKTTGGDLGYFTRGQMVPAFEEAAFSQEVGKISEKPIKTEWGFHVIQVEDHKEAVKPDFEKAKDNVKKDTLDYAKNQKIQSYYLKLRQDAKIEYSEELKPKTS